MVAEKEKKEKRRIHPIVGEFQKAVQVLNQKLVLEARQESIQKGEGGNESARKNNLLGLLA